MKKTLPKVCIIILNWNCYELTRECLISVQKIDYSNYKIILVDNGSVDKSVQKLTSEFPKIDLLELDRNYGFTGGNNKGISYAIDKYNPDYYLLLNNDTEVKADFLTKLIEPFLGSVKIYACVPKINYFSNKNVIWFAGGRVRKFTGNVKEYGINQIESTKYSMQRETGFMTGCAALISNNAISNLGMFDERFFAYSEDADFSKRILKSGHSIMFVPNAVVYHKVSQSFKKNNSNWFKSYLATRNIVFLQQKHLSKYIYPLFIVWFFFRWVIYLSIKFAIKLDFKQIPYLLKGYFDGLINYNRFKI